MMPTNEEMDKYLNTVTDYLYSVSDNLQELYSRLLTDFQRHAPPWQAASGLHLDIPAPSPPIRDTPPPVPWFKLGFIEDEDTRGRILMAAGVAGLVGVGCGTWAFLRLREDKRRRKVSLEKNKLRKEVIVVLGGDTPVGPALIHGLEKKGYVVITSVASADAVDALEKKSKGNVKALVLNPKEPASVPYFLRSLNAALALRYPVGTPGDPYLPTGTSPSSSGPTSNVLVSCISLLALNPTPTPTPLERINLSSDYLPLTYETHITPLAVIQGILPLFRVASSRQGVGHTRYKHSVTKTSIIVLVPVVASRVGVAFDGARGMAIAALVRGVEIMRREIGNETNVVLVDVGVISGLNTDEKTDPLHHSDVDIIELTQKWSASERRAYGPAYEAALVHSSAIQPSNSTTSRPKKHHPRRRTPTDIDTLVSRILPLVHASRSSRSQWHPLYIFTHFTRVWQRASLYLRGYRISVGAGALTYATASHLPLWILDSILSLPATLVSLKQQLRPSPQEQAPLPNRVGKPRRLIEGEERVMSTAPASTASGDSRRESVGSFEGVIVGQESGDEGHRLGEKEGTLETIVGFESTSNDSADTKSPSDGLARTPSLGSTLLPEHVQPIASTTDHGDRITDSWVSLADSRISTS